MKFPCKPVREVESVNPDKRSDFPPLRVPDSGIVSFLAAPVYLHAWEFRELFVGKAHFVESFESVDAVPQFTRIPL